MFELQWIVGNYVSEDQWSLHPKSAESQLEALCADLPENAESARVVTSGHLEAAFN